jgi:hypothetical protein
MERSTDVLLISPANNLRVQSPRSPLTRLILPIERIPDSLRLPVGRVWWAEAQRNRIWLRGCLQVERAVEEVSLNGHARRLVWETLPTIAERLTLPGRAYPAAADISRFVDERLTNRKQDFWVSEIPADLALELARRREVISESVWSFAAARRHYERLIQSLGMTCKALDLAGNLDAAWVFARTEFTRAELANLEGRDIYMVAAAAIAGYLEMPVGWTPCLNIHTDDFAQSTTFEELKVDSIGFSERAWVRGTTSALPSDELERSSKRHQEILKSLAQIAIEQGLHPTYNRYVDLRVVLPDSEVFVEVKSANEGNFLHQVRLAAGQLLEYRFRYKKHNGDKPIKLVAVIENIARVADIDFARRFLSDLEISLDLWDNSTKKMLFCSW